MNEEDIDRADHLRAVAKDNPAANTDRELWREREGDYYSPSIHVTAQGAIGINVGGTVHVRTLREWHAILECSDLEVNQILDRWDQTDPKIQRGIVAKFVERAAKLDESLLDVFVEIDQLADFVADSVELRIGETNIIERLNEICEKKDWQISKKGRQLIRNAGKAQPLTCANCGEASTNPGQFTPDGLWLCTEACRKELCDKQSYDDMAASGGIVDAP